MKKIILTTLLCLLMTIQAFQVAALDDSSGPVHPDDISCTDGDKRGDWYLETAGDGTDESILKSLAFWVYKFFNPVIHSHCQVEEFFKTQDLSFINDWSDNSPNIKTASLSAVGDLLPANEMLELENPALHSAHFYEDVAPSLFGADIVFGNLEAPVYDKSKTFPLLNLPSALADVYLPSLPKGAEYQNQPRFDVVSTANNHCFDQGVDGVKSTIQFLKDRNIDYAGTSETPDHKLSIIERNDINVAFLAYTFSTNNIEVPAEDKALLKVVNVNSLDPEVPASIETIKADIDKARAEADIIVVSMHWSVEFEFYPPRRIIDVGHKIADAGADVILGHHPHILNPLESYKPKNRLANGLPGVPEVLIAYSLGNFITMSIVNNSLRTGVILNVEFSKDLDKKRVWISKVEHTPTWWYVNAEHTDFRLLDINKAIGGGPEYDFLSCSDRLNLNISKNRYIDRFVGNTNLLTR